MPLLLDTFCKAGGCSRGYVEAGFEVVGVDIEPQKNYPYRFIQADALEFIADHGHEYDVIHASPPCQRYSTATKGWGNKLVEDHPDLVGPTRDALILSGKPYVIENVIGAPMGSALMLCGSMFGLLVRRHRLFEASMLLFSPGGCVHKRQKGNYPCGQSSKSARAGERSKVVHVYGSGCSRGDCDLWAEAMGIDWMTMGEMAQAIPPAYTRFIGKQLLESMGVRDG